MLKVLFTSLLFLSSCFSCPQKCLIEDEKIYKLRGCVVYKINRLIDEIEMEDDSTKLKYIVCKMECYSDVLQIIEYLLYLDNIHSMDK